MIIRNALPSERHEIEELTLRAYEEYAAVMKPAAWLGLRQAVLSGLANSASADCIVADRDGMLVGSVLLFPAETNAYAAAGSGSSSFPEVRLLAVPPERRGQGVARALVDECIQRARAQEAEYLGLHTSASMEVAIAIYRAMGFERAPQLDFMTEGSELIEGYRLPLRR